MLELINVSKRFSGIPAVDDITFTVFGGAVTGYLGPNGSGKSTTLKMITGLLDLSAGEIMFCGERIRDDIIAHRRRLGFVPEEAHLYTHLSGSEYLAMVAQLRNLPRKKSAEKINELLRLLGLHGDRHAAMAGYSKGMRQKILLAAALMHDPELVILDEPFSGLDVNSAMILRDLLQELARRGKTILFSSHELETMERICERVIILHRGKVIADDSIASLRASMALPTLEKIFSELAIEQNTSSIAIEIAELIHA